MYLLVSAVCMIDLLLGILTRNYILLDGGLVIFVLLGLELFYETRMGQLLRGVGSLCLLMAAVHFGILHLSQGAYIREPLCVFFQLGCLLLRCVGEWICIEIRKRT